MADVQQLAKKIATAASDKKARDIILLDMTGISSVTDSYVICSAGASRQVQAIADNIEEVLQKDGIEPLHIEGYREGSWVLLDYGSCVAHIFVERDRDFYNLEKLWGDAPSIPFAE